MEVTDELRETVRTELPEIAEIGDPVLRDKVIEVWATALAPTSFASIADIPASGNPGTPALKKAARPITCGASPAWPWSFATR